MGDFKFPNQGVNPRPPHWEYAVLPLDGQRSLWPFSYSIFKIDLIELFIYYGSLSLFLCSLYHILILRIQLRIRGTGFGGEWTHVHVWLSPFAVYLKPPQHCSSAIPQYKVKSLKFEKEKNMNDKAILIG